MASGGDIRKPSVAVVTATTGRDTLRQTIDSVRKQTYPCRHYVFVDGVVINQEADVEWVNLPVKTGGNGMMNGGIMAASAFLVQEDMICWLDDDNWFEPDHVEKLIAAKGNKSFAWSLRNLVNPDGTFFDHDDSESLGQYSNFIDCNCYLMDRTLAVQLAPLWYKTTGDLMIGDRHVYECLRSNGAEYGQSGHYTVNYRINPKRDLRPWFWENNIKVRAQFAGELPWRAK